MREAELIADKEKTLGQKVIEETNRLIDENARLTAELDAYRKSEGRWDKVGRPSLVQEVMGNSQLRSTANTSTNW